MEDAVDALKLAFSVFVFILGLSIVFNMFTQAREVSDYVLEHTDNTYFAKYVDANDSDLNGRTVGIETIIPTLYRYYKEKFSIDVVVDSPKEDSSGKYNGNNEKFDEEIERIVYNNATATVDDREIDIWKLYAPLYPDGISWIGSRANTDTQLRVTSYIEGKANSVNVKNLTKYASRNLKKYRNQNFIETFEQKDNGKKYIGEDGSVIYLVQGTTKLHITYTLEGL